MSVSSFDLLGYAGFGSDLKREPSLTKIVWKKKWNSILSRGNCPLVPHQNMMLSSVEVSCSVESGVMLYMNGELSGAGRALKK